MKTLRVAVTTCLISITAIEAQVTIDDFTQPDPPGFQLTGAGPLDTSGVPQSTVALGIPTVNVIGGAREVIATWDTGPFVPVDQINSTVVTASTSFSLGQNPSHDGSGEVFWNANGAGLGSADLTTGGASALKFNTTSNDLGATITVTFADNSGPAESISKVVAASTLGDTLFPFPQFTTIDFTDIESIRIKVDPPTDGDFSFNAVLSIQPQDFGDAPDSYCTTVASNGPRHALTFDTNGDHTGPRFGTNIDTETDAATPLDGTGDDVTLTLVPNADDEDGITVPVFTPGSSSTITANVQGAVGLVSIWVDWNVDGDFDDAGEQVVTDDSASLGNNNYNVNAPPGATPGTTYVRARISTTASLTQKGFAADGEVEDYSTTINSVNSDFGDAPDTYGTTLAASGARHIITGPRLGTEEDSENDGNPTANALGDDTTGTPDDEDGVTIPNCLDPGQTAIIPITVSGAAAKVSLWIDLNIDGDFTDAGEFLLNNVAQAIGTTNHNVAIPATATPGATYARIRVIDSADPNLTLPTGAAASGEVEDYAVTICADYGDAPDSYCTVLASNGARHADTGPFLGTERDTETDAAAVAPGAVANGDDNAGSPDDEDGVSFTPAAGFDLNVATSNSITFTIGNGPADVEVFIDWNKDGDFGDAGERLDFDGRATGVHNESIAIPGGTTTGNTYVRVRVYSPGTSLDSEKGFSPAGEVEDYRITISDTTFVDLLSFDAKVIESGQVAINWVTGAEIDTAGFNLLRGQLSRNDSLASYDTTKLNSQLIPSKGTSVEGAAYEVIDTPGYGTFYYQLEDIEVSGQAGLHPFAEVTILPELKISLDEQSNVQLNYLAIPGWNYEVEYKSLADLEADWQALPEGPHNDGIVSDEVPAGTSDRLYRLKASPIE